MCFIMWQIITRNNPFHWYLESRGHFYFLVRCNLRHSCAVLVLVCWKRILLESWFYISKVLLGPGNTRRFYVMFKVLLWPFHQQKEAAFSQLSKSIAPNQFCLVSKMVDGPASILRIRLLGRLWTSSIVKFLKNILPHLLGFSNFLGAVHF